MICDILPLTLEEHLLRLHREFYESTLLQIALGMLFLTGLLILLCNPGKNASSVHDSKEDSK